MNTQEQEKGKKILFPRIHRFITEGFVLVGKGSFIKIALVSFASGILCIGILLQSLLLAQNIVALSLVDQAKKQVTSEIEHWKAVAKEHPNYRDVYVRLAALESQMGNSEGSQVALKKVHELDPNFEETKILGAQKER